MVITLALAVKAAATLRGTGVRSIGMLFSVLGGAFFFCVYSRQESSFWGPAVGFAGSGILALGSLMTAGIDSGGRPRIPDEYV